MDPVLPRRRYDPIARGGGARQSVEAVPRNPGVRQRRLGFVEGAIEIVLPAPRDPGDMPPMAPADAAQRLAEQIAFEDNEFWGRRVDEMMQAYNEDEFWGTREGDEALRVQSIAVETREALEGEDTCYVCMVNYPDARFTPCNNTGICCACAQRITRSTGKCPLCRAAVTSFQLA